MEPNHVDTISFSGNIFTVKFTMIFPRGIHVTFLTGLEIFDCAAYSLGREHVCQIFQSYQTFVQQTFARIKNCFK
jgi:hypothetical protein